MRAENAIFHLSREHIYNEVARQEAIKALKKQIPKKLKGEKVGRFGLALLCPSCETQVAMIWDSVLQGKYKQKYCDKCGQALGWEDIK